MGGRVDLRLDAPPEDLLKLRLSARKPNKAFTLLGRLAQRGDPDAALSSLAGGCGKRSTGDKLTPWSWQVV